MQHRSLTALAAGLVVFTLAILAVGFMVHDVRQKVIQAAEEELIEATITIEGEGLDVSVHRMQGDTKEEWSDKIHESLEVAEEFEGGDDEEGD